MAIKLIGKERASANGITKLSPNPTIIEFKISSLVESENINLSFFLVAMIIRNINKLFIKLTIEKNICKRALKQRILHYSWKKMAA